MEFLDEVGAATAIRQFAAASSRCRLAVAFWGAGAAQSLGLIARSRQTTVICNLGMGGTNPAEIEKMMVAGIDVRQADDLHGKVYLFDGHAIIGSSNASANGLAFQAADGIGWREANVLVNDPALIQVIEEWMNSLVTKEISDEDLLRAKALWRRRRLLNVIPGKSRSLLEALKSTPGFFADKDAWLVVVSDEMSAHAEEMLAAINASEGADIDAYESFPSMPDQGQLLSFWLGKRGGLGFDNYWERTKSLTDRAIDGGTLQLVLPRDDVLGLKWSEDEKAEWTQIVGKVRQSNHWNSEHRCAAIRLQDLAQIAGFTHSITGGTASEEAFHEAMWALYRRAREEADYNAGDFYGMMTRSRGLLVAKRLLSGQPSSGFYELCQRGRRDLTVEALVLDSRWQSLFASEELRVAQRRLSEMEKRN